MALKIVLPPLLFLSTLSVADELRQNGEACDCFLTNGSSSSYFSYHRFHDFRNVVDLDLTVIPKVVESYDSDTNLVPTSDFFGKSSAWKGDWEIQMWNNSDQLTPLNAATGGPTVLMRNSANNVYIGMPTIQQTANLAAKATTEIRKQNQATTRIRTTPHF